MADEPEELPAIDAPSMTDETAVAPEEPEELPAFITDSLTEEPPEAPQEPEEWAAFETPSVPDRFPTRIVQRTSGWWANSASTYGTRRICASQ